jgi:ABC-type amino acid transport substrate-binding protein
MHAQESEDNKDDENATLMSEYLKILDIEADVKEYASYPEAIQALRDGFVDAVCASETALTKFGKTGMLLLPERFMPSDYRICFSQSAGLFSQAVNDVIATMKQDGTLDMLIQKWDLVNYQKLEEQ